MPHAPCDPAYDPDISKFIGWVQTQSVPGNLGADPDVKHPFMPLPRLEKYLKEGNTTKRLLQALFPTSEPPIGPEEVWRTCIRVFSILLLVGRGSSIPHFVQHDQLWDSKLPFLSPPLHFPPTAGDDTFFDLFFKQQWHFYPHMFLRNVIDHQIDKECILPIVDMEKLGDGGSALTYKIKLHPAYDNLEAPTAIRRDSGYSYANTYVLKRYRSKDAKENYETEVKAFRALMAGGSLGKSIIGFYGSYIQDGSYNVLLEYADRGTLEEYLQNTPPPTTGEDIFKFWSALFNVIQALHLIHNVQGNDPNDPPILQGWHQDINPSNILVTSGKSGSRFDCEFKIADLGLSHFRKVRASHGAAADRDTSGTRQYGAPECYRFNEFMERSSLVVKQTVDIWSLGCVLSEVAVWLVHDKDRLETYRKERHDETNQLYDFKDGRAFHDSEKVLQSVGCMHEEVFENVRKSDHVTRSVVKKMINEMLDEVDGRPNTKQLWFKARNILRDAEKKLKGATGEQPEPDMQSQKREPPVVPPDFPHSQSDHTDQNGVIKRWSSLNRKEQRRSATINVLARENTSSPETTADAGYESPDEMSNTTLTPPTSPPYPNHNSHNQYPHHSAHSSTYHPTSPIQQHQTDSLGQNHPPAPHGKALTRASIRGSDQLQDRSLPGPMSGLNIRDSTEIFPEDPLAEDPAPQQVSSGPPQSESVQTKTATMSISSPPDKQHVKRQLPYTSVVEAENWMLKKKQRGNSHHTLEHKELLDQMYERDHVFLVDDAASMSPHWNKLISVVSVLAYLLKYTDDDGMDLYFSISQDKHNAKTSSELVQKLRGKARKGTSDIGSRLSTILHRYQTYLQEPVSNRRSLLGKVKPKLKKALNVYILTDAIWQPHSDATEPIASLITMLKKSDYPRKQVGIQFIRFGDDPGGIDKLEHLDSGLGLSWDIVDAEPADGNVWKMLLGAVNKWFDGDEDEDNNDKTTQES